MILWSLKLPKFIGLIDKNMMEPPENGLPNTPCKRYFISNSYRCRRVCREQNLEEGGWSKHSFNIIEMKLFHMFYFSPWVLNQRHEGAWRRFAAHGSNFQEPGELWLPSGFDGLHVGNLGFTLEILWYRVLFGFRRSGGSYSWANPMPSSAWQFSSPEIIDYFRTSSQR